MNINNLKTALRNLINHKMYSTIKIGGFALGIAVCLLIAFFIKDELSYDKQYPDVDRIYRIVGEYHIQGQIIKESCFPAPFAKTVKETFPEIEKSGRINANELLGAGGIELRRTDQKQSNYEVGMVFADQELIDLLKFPFVFGDPESALSKPKSMVISKSMADKYFPNQNPVGQLLVINNKNEFTYTVGGVIADIPLNSHLKYRIFLTMESQAFGDGEQSNWLASNYFSYIKVKPGIDIKSLETKFDAITTKYFTPNFIEAGFIKKENTKDYLRFKLQPITDIHLKSDGIDDRLNHGDILFLWIFGAIALFILILAGINFINLSTAISANRAKEVGLRKAIGSLRKNLINQFITESLFFSFLSFIVGIILAWLLLPLFNFISGKSLVIPLGETWLLPILGASAVLVGLLSGLYPAFYLSSFKPIDVLKGNLGLSGRSSGIRSGLVIFQFTASIFLIAGTFIIQNQLGYIMNKKLGFDKEQVLILNGTNTLGNNLKPFKERLLELSSVKSVSVSDFLPVNGTKRNNNPWWNEGRTKEDKSIAGQIWEVDYDYIKTMGMKVVEGRDFSTDMATDNRAIIINQMMKKQLGLENPVGKTITNSFQKWTVIGVVENFHFESLRSEIKPLALFAGNSNSIVSIRASSSNISSLIASVNKIWNEFSPNQEIRYSFLDQQFARMYQDVARMERVFISFSLMAIVVACLGLFGLITFATQQKRKEIGVRKVNGARISEIVVLLNKEIIKWVSISFVIATPTSWYAMHKWLENFAYKTELSWWIFALAGLLALGIALMTVSWQSWKAATRNPVEALRYE
ncbi:MAG: ABC transporter permease [Bacteroidia bacterium]|nr:ABC transporter permease [Bacteroidia bacterium]